MKKHTFTHKSRRLRRFLRANEAVSALEYAILVGVISAAMVGVFATFNTEILDAISTIGANVDANMSTVGQAAPF